LLPPAILLQPIFLAAQSVQSLVPSSRKEQRMRVLVGLTAFVFVCTGCVHTNAAVLDPSVSYQKICPDGVQMFTSAERVPGQYQEVAILNSKGESGWTDEKGMMRSQQKKAASLGANGIILGDTKEPNAGTKIIGAILGTGAERKGKAIAIFIPSDTARVQRACKTTPQALNQRYHDPDEQPAASPNAFAGAPGHEVPRPAAQSPEPYAPALTSLQAPTPAPAPEPTPTPTDTTPTPGQPYVAPVAGVTALPLGTDYVGDSRIKVYYPLGCAAQHAIPPDMQIFFQTAEGAERDGFKRSGDC
jgi:hypothetical protein